MPVFYRGPRALITHEVFAVSHVVRRGFPLADLTRPQVVQRGPDAAASRHRMLAMSAGAAMLLVVPIVGQVSTLLMMVALVASTVYLGACLRTRQPVRYELVALCRGEVVVLFSSADQREFDQVGRGLQRAMEYRWRHG